MLRYTIHAFNLISPYLGRLLTFQILACLFPAFAFGNTVDAGKGFDKVNLSEYVEVFIDEGDEHTTYPAVKNADFKKNTQDIINHGFVETPLWMRFSVRADKAKALMLELGNSNLDAIDIYELNFDGTLKNHLLGDHLNFNERLVPLRTHVYPIYFEGPGVKEFYVRVHTQGVLQVPLLLASQEAFLVGTVKAEIAYGIVVGIMCVMIVYNLLIFFSLRDVNYLLYAFPVIANTLFFFSVKGHVFQYLLPDFPEASNYMTVISIAMWIFTSSLYAKSSLSAKRFSKRADLAFSITMGLGVFGMLLPFISSYAFAVRFNSVMTLVNSLTMFIASLVIWRRGNTSARFFIIAWTVYLAGTFIYALMKSGVLPTTALTSNILAIGSTIEVLFLSLALSDCYKLFKREKELAQSLLIKQQEEANATLEKKVKERTLQIEKQREQLAKTHQNIKSSITYALRIQKALLPDMSIMKRHFPNSFLFHKPRDIVSGDFFWSDNVDGKLILAAIDCTGHGVPGAFMSLIGNNLISQIVKIEGIISPERILQALHEHIINSIGSGENRLNDGMDVSLIVYHPEEKLLEYAGARNPLVFIQDGKLGMVKGTRASIGTPHKKVAFQKHSLHITQPTTFYIYSDGFQDQFGGIYDAKYGTKKFRELLEKISAYPMERQKDLLNEELRQWMSSVQNGFQTDDILIIGFEMEGEREKDERAVEVLAELEVS